MVALVGTDDLEVLVDEDVVRPVDADVVDLVLAVAQPYNPVDVSRGRRFAFFATTPLTIVPDP
jgi:hypothetical protein